MTASPRNDRNELPMPTQISELRCPSCQKLAMGLSEDFAGAVSIPCHRCDHLVTFPLGGTARSERIECRCGKWLASGLIQRGSIRTPCKRCRALVQNSASGAIYVTLPRRRADAPQQDIVGMIEQRWAALRLDRAMQSAIRVGLRFEVFQRDGFRCRYCGKGPTNGSILEADHFVPRSKGGPDTIANLVTACAECNRGKAARTLTGGLPGA